MEPKQATNIQYEPVQENESNYDKNHSLNILKSKHRARIIVRNNLISTIYNNCRYSLVLDNYQFNKFNKDFSSDALSYDFTFWLRALYIFGTCYKLEEDLPE